MAKKKYYQSARDRRDESRGMKKKDRERGMITEDYNAVANLPQQVIMKEWPEAQYGLDGYYDDGISGVDKQMYKDVSKARSRMSDQKY